MSQTIWDKIDYFLEYVVDFILNIIFYFIGYLMKKKEITPESRILKLCGQSDLLQFEDVTTKRILKKCTKIDEFPCGEEVFSTLNASNQQVRIKIIPVFGDLSDQDERQRSFAKLLPEILISSELTALRENCINSACNFACLNKVSCVYGQYPCRLLKEWDRYNEEFESNNERPDSYLEDQVFILHELEEGGTNIRCFQLNNALQALSIFCQVASSLAVAENALEFEHRDLNWTNILICETDKSSLAYSLNGVGFSLLTYGVRAVITNFTRSRMRKGDETIYCDLSEDDCLFLESGEYKYDIYREMRKQNKNNWKSYCPYTNVLWLHYLLDMLLFKKTYLDAYSELPKNAYKLLIEQHKSLLTYRSCLHVVMDCNFPRQFD